jgi:hypothetical protein
MTSGLFEAHVEMMPKLHAEMMLDAATAATAQFQKAEWWDRLVLRARGAATEVMRRAFPMFTWNGAPVNSSAGLRQRFAQGVSGARVES